MSFFWTSATYPLYINDDPKINTGITFEHYFLYTKDIQNTNGGTIGSRSVDPKPDRFSDNYIHPDTVRYGSTETHAGGDSSVSWTMLAEFPKPGSPLVIIRVWVQGIIPTTALGEGNAGKELLIPLNSGPSYLATRSGDDYISTSTFLSTWTCIKAGSHTASPWIANDYKHPSEQALTPFASTDSPGSSSRSNTYVYTPTGSYVMNEGTGPVYMPYTSTGQIAISLPIEAFQQLETPSTSQPYGTTGSFTVSTADRYTGGDFSFYVIISQLDTYDYPEPQNVQVLYRNTGAGVTYINTINMSLQSTLNSDGRNYYVYTATGTPLTALGDSQRNSENYILVGYEVSIDEPDFINWENTIVIEMKSMCYDPWVSYQMPPHYTVTTTDNRCIIGGVYDQNA